MSPIGLFLQEIFLKISQEGKNIQVRSSYLREVINEGTIKPLIFLTFNSSNKNLFVQTNNSLLDDYNYK